MEMAASTSRVCPTSVSLLPSSPRLPRHVALITKPPPLGQLSRFRSLRRSFSPRSPQRVAVVATAQSIIFKVLRTTWKVAKDGIEAGTSLVPDSVPRPVARIGVTVVAVSVSLFLLKSFLSTVFFVLMVMGLIYLTFIALNTDEGPKGGGNISSTEEETLEEARRIMEKYK